MKKLTIRDVDVKGHRVLMRVDFNVPVKEGKVGDLTRITAAIPTIKYVLEKGGSLVLMSHLGRPKGKGYEAEFSLKPVAAKLEELLGKPVKFGTDCVGAETIAQAKALKAGEIMVVENTRFYKEEEGKAKLADDATDEQKKAAKAEMKAKQKELAKKMAELGDGEIFCNDAFGSAHRAHASTAIVCQFYKKNVAGFLMEKEIDYLGKALEAPEKPFVAIIGGAKISGKIDVVTSLMDKCDAILIGGGMAYTFYKAQGFKVGNSLVEDDRVEMAKDILAQAKAKGVKLMLPIDNLAADKFDVAANTKVVGENIDDGWMALDIGPKTIDLYCAEVAKAKTVVWNGPMGCFEMAPFAKGTFAVCQAVADSDSVSIIGGGDSVSAVNKSGLADKMTHISTGGGASLEFLEGKQLPGVTALTDK
ncbi:MAG: phosphoglycerate kinase [Verrucomicrobia bacterium]|nr:phosphoglycerate kinase [Verrucomicrobiota bacterium]